MDDVTAVLNGLDKSPPDDEDARTRVADVLDDARWGWGVALRAAAELHRHVPGLVLPDRFPTFRTPSYGWEAVGTR